jgi:hypothetical protein
MLLQPTITPIPATREIDTTRTRMKVSKDLAQRLVRGILRALNNGQTTLHRAGSPVLQRQHNKMARYGRPFSLSLRLLSVDLFNQVVLCSHLLDLVKLGLDKIYMSFLFLEN